MSYQIGANSLFTITAKCSQTKARSGILTLDRGQIQTPVFMPIGTQGSVKSLSVSDLEKLDYQIILGNTYHLWFKPGLEVIQAFAGLHNFSNWQKPILTDSGGFQAFSLAKMRRFTEEGVIFQTKNGEKRLLTPEISMQIQEILGSDIALVLDEALPAEVDYKEAQRAMLRTYRWAERSKREWLRLQQNNSSKTESNLNAEEILEELESIQKIIESW